MAKNEIATQDTNTALMASSDLPEWLKKGGNRGSEEVSSNDIVLPRIGVLQALSPQIKKSDPKYIPGAEQGLLWNTLTNELYLEGTLFIGVKFVKEWIAFVDRDKGGGFRGAWPFKDEMKARAEVDAMEDAQDIELMESHSHIGFLLKPNGDLEQAVIACTKSAIKFSRKFNALVVQGGVDRFAKAYKIFAIETSSAKGDYYTFDVSAAGYVSQEVYKQAETMYEQLKDKTVSTNHSDDEGLAGKSNSAAEEREF